MNISDRAAFFNKNPADCWAIVPDSLHSLLDGHSKSLRHHTAMQTLFVAWYNFGRKHEALKGNTPAMASNLTDHAWTIKELIERAAR